MSSLLLPLLTPKQASHRVFSIAELLDAIMQFMDTPELASCAQVCRFWEIPSLRILWRNSSKPSSFLKLLGPLDPDTLELRFQGRINPENWGRYYRYASFIRKATIHVSSALEDGDNLDVEYVSPSVIHQAQLAALWTQSAILPDVTDLELVPYDFASSETSICFIGTKLRHLRLDWRMQSNWEHLVLCLKRIHCCEMLSSLYIDLDNSPETVPQIVSGVIDALVSLPKLRTFGLPTSLAFQPEVWNAMRGHPSLEVFQCMKEPTRIPKTYSDQIGFGGFLSLKTFESEITYGEAMTILHPSSEPTSIIDFRLKVSGGMALNFFRSLTAAVADAIPHLERLTLSFTDSISRLAIRNLAPLFKLRNLVQLHIDDTHASILSDSDFETLAAAFPDLQELSISATPLPPFTAPLATLLALNHIAKHCRSVRKIAIYVDTSSHRLPSVTSSNNAVSPFSRTLESISFGFSPVIDPYAIALRLVRLLSLGHSPVIHACEDLPTVTGTGPGTSDILNQEDEMTLLRAIARQQWGEVADAVIELRAVERRAISSTAEPSERAAHLELISRLRRENEAMERKILELELIGSTMMSPVLDVVVGVDARDDAVVVDLGGGIDHATDGVADHQGLRRRVSRGGGHDTGSDPYQMTIPFQTPSREVGLAFEEASASGGSGSGDEAVDEIRGKHMLSEYDEYGADTPFEWIEGAASRQGKWGSAAGIVVRSSHIRNSPASKSNSKSRPVSSYYAGLFSMFG